MRVLWAVVLGAMLAPPAGASAEPGDGPRARTVPPLRTPWPARDGCTSYASVDLSVDDRVSVVEWRGANGASLTLDLPKPTGREETERYRLGSDGNDCHSSETSCILYGDRTGPEQWVRTARVSKPLPSGLLAGTLDELVLHPDVRRAGRPPRTRDALEFGLRIVLHCGDESKPSVAWACDARSCVPRTFRDNQKLQVLWRAEQQKPPRERHYEPAVAGPYGRRWDRGDPTKDLGRLICMRGTFERAQAVRAAGGGDFCLGGALPSAQARPAVVELARDLLVELGLVLEEGCAGTCAAPVDELRATASALGAAPDLRLRGIRAVFDEGDPDDLQGAFPSLGWVARLAGRPGAVELACARYKKMGSAGEPVVRACRLTVIARGRRLANYAPNRNQAIELPDGGAVHVSDRAPSGDDPRDGYFDHIVIIGSALAQRPLRATTR